jgi:hypothetical protein
MIIGQRLNGRKVNLLHDHPPDQGPAGAGQRQCDGGEPVGQRAEIHQTVDGLNGFPAQNAEPNFSYHFISSLPG